MNLQVMPKKEKMPEQKNTPARPLNIKQGKTDKTPHNAPILHPRSTQTCEGKES
jgi:hypothetical protein